MTIETPQAPATSEATVRQRLRTRGYVVRDSARDAAAERWGDEWEHWLAAGARRLATHGSAVYDADGKKWVVSDRRDKMILSSDGRVVVAVFPGSLDPAEVVRRLEEGELTLASMAATIVSDRLGPDGSAQALRRLTEMAHGGTMTWRSDNAAGGWRLADGGDVALLDARGRYVQKLFWSVMDQRPGVGVDAVREALAAGTVRPGRRMMWRLERAWGPEWESHLRGWMARLAANGEIAEQGDNAYAAQDAEGSLLISRDAEVVVSTWVTIAGDPDDIRRAAAGGDLAAHPDLAPDMDRYRAATADVLTHFGCVLASLSEAEKTSTHWRLSFEGIEVAVDASGKFLTALTTRPTDDVEVARARLSAGVFWARPKVAELLARDLGDNWPELLTSAPMQNTSRGWEIELPGGTLGADRSAALLVVWRSDAERG
jgi:hypothetical protein